MSSTLATPSLRSTSLLELKEGRHVSANARLAVGEEEGVEAQRQAVVKQLGGEIEGMRKQLQFLNETSVFHKTKKKGDDSSDDEEDDDSDDFEEEKPVEFNDDPTRFGMYNMDEGKVDILDKNQAAALIHREKQEVQDAGSDASEAGEGVFGEQTDDEEHESREESNEYEGPDANEAPVEDEGSQLD